MGQMALRSAFHASDSDVEICSAHLRLVAIKKPHVHTRTSGLENPELRTRSRPGNKLIFLTRPREGNMGWYVSIHARARRATVQPLAAGRFPRFNPRPRAAGDGRSPSYLRLRLGFNPRPRAAGDTQLIWAAAERTVSIHARARRATFWYSDGSSFSRFQSTPARGGR